jgi:hypothetical protein
MRLAQEPVHPRKGLAGGELAGRRVSVVRQAALEMPGQEHCLSLGMPVWKAALVIHRY